MKLVYLSDSIVPSRSANSIQVMRMCDAFAGLGHDVHVLVPGGRFDVDAEAENVFAYYGVPARFTIEQIDWPPLRRAGRIWAIEAALRAADLAPDLVYARYMPGAVFAAELGLPVIFEVHRFAAKYHGNDRFAAWIETAWRTAIGVLQYTGLCLNACSFRRRTGAADRALRRVCRTLIRGRGWASSAGLFARLAAHPRTLRIVAITRGLAAEIAVFHPRATPKLRVVPDGAAPPARDSPTVALRTRAGAVDVGYCGQLYPGKGMEIVARLAPICPWAQFHVVGGLEADIRTWQYRLAGLANVVFYGHVEPAAAAAYIDRFDVCLLPNQPSTATYGKALTRAKIDIGRYTSPLKMFEYMSAGKPIVASDLPVLREILEHDVNALLCAFDDIDAWRDALERMVAEPARARRLGQRARRDVLARYTWTHRARRVLAEETARVHRAHA